MGQWTEGFGVDILRRFRQERPEAMGSQGGQV